MSPKASHEQRAHTTSERACQAASGQSKASGAALAMSIVVHGETPQRDAGRFA